MGRGMGRSLRSRRLPPPVRGEAVALFRHLDLLLNRPWTVSDIWTEVVIVVVPDGVEGCCKRTVEQSCRDPWQQIVQTHDGPGQVAMPVVSLMRLCF